MYPYIDIGSFHLGTFGLMLWLAAVVATVVLHKNFVRNGVDADALNVVALVVIAGIIGAKTWHELQDVADLRAAMHQIGLPGWHHPMDVVMGFLHWFQAGFAWFGGIAGWDCDADVAGAAGSIQRAAKRRDVGMGRWGRCGCWIWRLRRRRLGMGWGGLGV